MEIKIKKINQILAEWDPIEIGEDMAQDEYAGYIPKILQYCRDRNKQKLIDYLHYIIIEDLGLNPMMTDKELFSELQVICDKIIQVYFSED